MAADEQSAADRWVRAGQVDLRAAAGVASSPPGWPVSATSWVADPAKSGPGKGISLFSRQGIDAGGSFGPEAETLVLHGP